MASMMMETGSPETCLDQGYGAKLGGGALMVGPDQVQPKRAIQVHCVGPPPPGKAVGVAGVGKNWWLRPWWSRPQLLKLKHDWLRNTSVTRTQKRWWRQLGRGRSGHFCLVCCPHDPAECIGVQINRYTLKNTILTTQWARTIQQTTVWETTQLC